MINIQNFFSKDYTYAIVGASSNQDKYGYKILEALKQVNFKAMPINPNESEILGIKVYESLNQIKKTIDVVDFVVPPKITLQVLEIVKQLGIKKVWFQPGSYDSKCESFCKKNKIQYLKDFCLLKETLKKLN